MEEEIQVTISEQDEPDHPDPAEMREICLGALADLEDIAAKHPVIGPPYTLPELRGAINILKRHVDTIPKQIILDTAVHIRAFEKSTARMTAVDYDRSEIISALIGALMTQQGYMENLNLVCKRYENHGVFNFKHSGGLDKNGCDKKISQDGLILSEAMFTLGMAFYESFVSKGVYIGGQLDYYYDRIIDGNLVLARLPY